MSKKKRTTTKKHRISPSHLAGAPAQPAVLTPQAQPQTANVDVNVTAFVAPEVRKVLTLAAIFIGAEVALWLLFTHTGLGSAVYNAVKP